MRKKLSSVCSQSYFVIAGSQPPDSLVITVTSMHIILSTVFPSLKRINKVGGVLYKRSYVTDVVFVSSIVNTNEFQLTSRVRFSCQRPLIMFTPYPPRLLLTVRDSSSITTGLLH